MASFNKVILMGRTTSVPEVRETASGVSVANFTLAVDRGFGDDKQTDFIPVVAWRGTAETIAKYVGKGQQILVSGSLQVRSWEDKDGNKRTTTEVSATEFAFCEAKKESETNPPREQKSAAQGETRAQNRYKQASFEEVDDDDDLPF